MPTELYGNSIDMDRLLEICERYGVPAVLDAAESLGSKYKGSYGRKAKMVVYSFNGNKIITTSGGGMLLGHEKEIVEKARYLSQQARLPLSHYEHCEIGYNYRMSNILAAIGRGQLRSLEQRVRQKRQIFAYYQNSFADVQGISFIPEPSYCISNRWLSVILIDPELFGADRETVRLALEQWNVESRPVWKPMHLQPVFRDGTVPFRAIGGAVSERLFEQGLCLPSGTNLKQSDQDRIVDIILSCRSKTIV
jgi:dTDP-4-amino-4,6-dideoxygalactose transaminase